MAKTEKELQELKVKVEELNKELRELSEEELDKVAGGVGRLGSSNYTGVLNFCGLDRPGRGDIP